VTQIFLFAFGATLGLCLVLLGFALIAHWVFYSRAVDEDTAMFPCNRKSKNAKEGVRCSA
jgi:hypothetical protein